jgi:sensor histidine kinase YesM
VPPFLLQPLVENAVKHGITPLRDGGAVVVSAALQSAAAEKSRLVLTVRDTGVGTTQRDLEQRQREGVGLRNVERRLAYQYGEAASLVVRTAPGHGMTVTIFLPAEFFARDHSARRVV